jgi:hypothetical protein
VVASTELDNALQRDDFLGKLEPAQRWPFLLLLLQHRIVQLNSVLKVGRFGSASLLPPTSHLQACQ